MKARDAVAWVAPLVPALPVPSGPVRERRPSRSSCRAVWPATVKASAVAPGAAAVVVPTGYQSSACPARSVSWAGATAPAANGPIVIG